MSQETGTIEQRKDTRYRVSDHAYALLRQSNYTELGKIIDISSSGIAFLCLNEGDWNSAPFVIDILVGPTPSTADIEASCLKGIPLEPLRYSTDRGQGADANRIMKRCGVRFGQLSPAQREQLDLFIARHTRGHA